MNDLHYRLVIKYNDGLLNTYILDSYGDCLAIIERQLRLYGDTITFYTIEEFINGAGYEL